MQRTIRIRAVVGGLIVAALAAPYVWHTDSRQPLLLLRLAFLPPLAILSFQMALAWTPFAEGRAMLSRNIGRRQLVRIAVVGVVLAFIETFLLDPLISCNLPGYLPANRADVLIGLPWFAVFQPLLLVAAVYAFAVRFYPHPWVGIAAVVVVRTGLVVAQMSESLQFSATMAFGCGAAVYALAAGIGYRYCGFAGPVLLAFILTSRFFFTL